MIRSNQDRDNNVEKTTIGTINQIKEIAKHIYTEDEIDRFSLKAAIENHPLQHKPALMRSKLAYQQLLLNATKTTKYLLPGQIVLFNYNEPKYKEELEYYDKTPLTMFFGITRTNDGVIREIGLNLHYYPPFARMNILNSAYEAFKSYFQKYFNDPSPKPNMFISYKALKHIIKTNTKLAFGIKMYIPVLRTNSYLIPTRLLGTAFYTEGHFSKATFIQVQRFWRRYRP